MEEPVVEVSLDTTDVSDRHSLASNAEPGARPNRAGIAIAIAGVALLGVLFLLGDDRAPDLPSLGGDAAETQAPDTETIGTEAPVVEVSVAETNPAVYITGEPEPVLGSQVNFEVWFGGDAKIRRFDLDSGALTTFDAGGFPLFTAGDWLTVFTPGSGYATIDRTEPNVAPMIIDTGDDFNELAIGRSRLPGFVWAVQERADADGYDWLQISLTTGLPIKTLQTESVQLTRISFGVNVALPPVVDVRADGIYFLNANGFSLVTDGELVAYDERRALIEGCLPGLANESPDPELSTCGLHWWDIDQALPLDVPPPVGLNQNNELLGDGSWLYSWSDGAAESDLVEVFTSRTFDTQIRIEGRELDISPDGRWAVIAGGQRLRIMHLVSGEVVEIGEVASRIGTTSSIVATRQLDS